MVTGPFDFVCSGRLEDAVNYCIKDYNMEGCG